MLRIGMGGATPPLASLTQWDFMAYTTTILLFALREEIYKAYVFVSSAGQWNMQDS
jgi:hypothetical protein